MKARRFFVTLLAALLLAVALPAACSRSADLCDQRCECELCNDRTYDECIIDIDTRFDRADAYDCAKEGDAYYECVMDRSECDNYSWHVDGDDCDDELKDYSDCEADATGYDNGTSSSSSSSSSNGQGGAGCIHTCPCVCPCGTADVTDNEQCLDCVQECAAECLTMCGAGGAGGT